MKRLAQSRLVDAVLATVLWVAFATIAGVALTLITVTGWQVLNNPGTALHTGWLGAVCTLGAWWMRPCAPIDR